MHTTYILKIALIVSLVSYISSAAFPKRISSLGNRIPKNIPQADYVNMDQAQTLIVNTITFPNGVTIGSDLYINDFNGVEFNFNHYHASNFPGWMLIPDKLSGYKARLAFAHMDSIVNTNNSYWTFNASYAGQSFSIKFTPNFSVNNASVVVNFFLRVTQEREYSRNIDRLIYSNLSSLTNSLVSDKAAIDAYSGTYQSDKNQIATLNSNISNLATQLQNKVNEYNSNLIVLNNANQDMGTYKSNYNQANVDNDKCNSDKNTLTNKQKLLQDYKENFTKDTANADLNDVYSMQCNFVTTTEDIALLLPAQKLNIYGLLHDVVKLNKFDSANNYFGSKNCYINNMH